MDDGTACGRAPRQSGHREDVDLAGVATSGGVNFDSRTIFYLHRRLCVLVFGFNNAATADRLDRRATNWLGRRDPALFPAFRYAPAGVGLRSPAWNPLAFRD